MRAEYIKIHNFRTFADIEVKLSSYSLLIGANNSGKSNVIDAIRIFYEKDIKYEENRDFPKFETEDNESWIEIQFRPSEDEFKLLKEDYRLLDGTFKVRKYLQSSERDDEGKPKNGIYAYVGGNISNSRFYGAKNVQQAKFGEIIYIPAVSKLDEHTKLTGPSAFRDLINAVLKKIMIVSPSYSELKTAFEQFGSKLKTETTSDGQSLSLIETEITNEISDWGTSFELFINPITPEDLVKSLVGHQVQDRALGQSLDPKCYGQGFQRHLIFTLIKLSARYTAPDKKVTPKDFSPQLTWLLFEEPEAFLHPGQIDILDISLREISNSDGSQVLITTHSPEFVSMNIEDLPALIRLCKDGKYTVVGQVTDATLSTLFFDNQRDLADWLAAGIPIHPDDLMIDMESIKYALWLDPRRCSAFFANKVLLVEGPTETALIRYLLGMGQMPGPIGGVFILDTMGKFNLHRFMNLLRELRIYHAVLYDYDNGKYPNVDNTILAAKNAYTINVDMFPQDIEGFLGIPHAGRDHRKPQHVMYYLNQGKIPQECLNDLILKIRMLLGC